jgi:hypothetical protein
MPMAALAPKRRSSGMKRINAIRSARQSALDGAPRMDGHAAEQRVTPGRTGCGRSDTAECRCGRKCLTSEEKDHTIEPVRADRMISELAALARIVT